MLLKIAMGREAWHGIRHGTSSSLEAETDGLIVSRKNYGGQTKIPRFAPDKPGREGVVVCSSLCRSAAAEHDL